MLTATTARQDSIGPAVDAGRPHSRAKYTVEGCRCTTCRAANARYANQRELRHLRGIQTLVDADPVRRHIDHLRDAGLGWRRVAELAGVQTSTMSKILYGTPRRAPSARVRPATARKILAVTATTQTLAGRQLVDATGTHRRLQALVAIGWAQAELARRLGVSPQNFSTMLSRDRVHADTARAVRTLFDDLWDTPPATDSPAARMSATRAVRHATAHGWVPPLAWDDNTIDDPAAAPASGDERLVDEDLVDEVLVERTVAGHRVSRPLTTAERRRVAVGLVLAGRTITAAAAEVGLSTSTVSRLVLAHRTAPAGQP